MGSPVGPLLGNILLSRFEEKSVVTGDARPLIWFKCINDTFTMHAYALVFHCFWKTAKEINDKYSTRLKLYFTRKLTKKKFSRNWKFVFRSAFEPESFLHEKSCKTIAWHEQQYPIHKIDSFV